MLFIVIVTGSRGGFLVLAGLAFFISYRSPYRKLAMVIGIVLAVLMWSMMDPEYQHRFSTITQMGESDTSAENRILGLKHGFLMLQEHPILGVGVGCYPVARWHMFHNSLWAHNLPGQLMGDLGILGTVTFLVFLFKCFKNTRETRRILVENGMQSSLLYYQAMAMEASLFAQIINGIGQHSLYLYGFYVIGALTVVILRITELKAKEKTVEEVHSEENINHRLLFPSHTVKRRVPPA
jgi:O-antigen ligase